MGMTAGTLAFGYDKEDLERLRKTQKCLGCDLSYADLSYTHLAGANLTGADLEGVNL